MRIARNAVATAVLGAVLATPVAIPAHHHPRVGVREAVSTPVVTAIRHAPRVASRSHARLPIDDIRLMKRTQLHALRLQLRRARARAARRAERRRLHLIYSSSRAWAAQPEAIAVANCESGPGPGAPRYDRYVGNINEGGAHRGKWQFSPSTYASVGGVGDAAYASEAEQDYRAWLLWKRDGWSQWECAGLV